MPLTKVVVILLPDGDRTTAASAVTGWGIVIAATDTSLSATERGKIVKALIESIDSEDGGEVRTEAATYSARNNGQIGIWFTASDR